MEEETFGIPIYDPNETHSKIDELLGNKPNDLTVAFKKPTCPDCGKEFGFFFWKQHMPERYENYCKDCAYKHVQEDLAKDDSDDLLLELYEKLDSDSLYHFLSDEQRERAYNLYATKQEKEEHIKYFNEVKDLYNQAFELSTEHKTSVDFEFYALLLQRIDKSIEENSYKSDPRNIVFR